MLLFEIIYQEKIKISLDFRLDKANLNKFDSDSRLDSSTLEKSLMNIVALLQQGTRRETMQQGTRRPRRTRKMKRKTQT